MKLEKTETGPGYRIVNNFGSIFIPESDYSALRDHFRKEIAGEFTDERIKAESKEMYQVNPDFDNMEFMISMQQAYRAGARWLRDLIAGEDKG